MSQDKKPKGFNNESNIPSLGTSKITKDKFGAESNAYGSKNKKSNQDNEYKKR